MENQDKPVSLTIKEFLIRKMAVKMMISEKVLETVINHQFTSANEALKTNDSVEISGFGKFIFNKNKAVKKMDMLERLKKHYEETMANPDATELKKTKATQNIVNVLNNINALKPKVYGNVETDCRGMEEQFDSPSSFETFDNED